MTYECGRCHKSVSTLDANGQPAEPHLCADLRKRYERQRAAISLVVGVLQEAAPAGYSMKPLGEWHQETAEKIVTALAGRDLGT